MMVGITQTAKRAHVCILRITEKRMRYGEELLRMRHGRRLRRKVAVERASGQNEGGMAAWSSSVRTVSFSVRRIRLARPFCWLVYRHVRRREMPSVALVKFLSVVSLKIKNRHLKLRGNVLMK